MAAPIVDEKQETNGIFSPIKRTDEFVIESVTQFVTPGTKQDVAEFLKKIPHTFDEKEDIEKAESWLEWAKRLKYLKVVEAVVPDFILPGKCSAELIDVKVFTKRGPDDAIYDSYKSVRDRVARGNCFMCIKNGPHRGSRCILYALKKFTGGLGDDDDREKGDNFTWKKYFTKPLESAHKIIATRKANGEAAHLSCIQIEGHPLICAGSKNVHMLIRNRGDIKFYRDSRYRIAAEVCHSIMDCLEDMEPLQRERLLNFLIATRLTAVFEILSPDHQHVEDLSHLSKPIVQFITWTMIELEPRPDEVLCTVPPHIGIELARALGLQTVEYETIEPSEVDKRMKQIRRGYNYEGEVLYFVDENAAVMGLLKKKTVWYIICRAIREKTRNAGGNMIKNKSTFSLNKCVQQVEKRLGEIQTWLGLSDDDTAKWKNLGVAFLKWAINGLENGEISMEDIADKFPVIWKQHLQVSGLSDQIVVDCKEEEIPPDGASAFPDS